MKVKIEIKSKEITRFQKNNSRPSRYIYKMFCYTIFMNLACCLLVTSANFALFDGELERVQDSIYLVLLKRETCLMKKRTYELDPFLYLGIGAV